GGGGGGAGVGGAWPAASGGPPVLIGSWAGSRWIPRAAREFDGWVSSGARSNWRLIREGIARFRELGGSRAVLTNVAVRLDDTAASSDGPDDPFDLVCPRSVAIARIAHLKDLGFDDVVLVSRRQDGASLRGLRAVVGGGPPWAQPPPAESARRSNASRCEAAPAGRTPAVLVVR